MPSATIATRVHQSFDIHGDFSSSITFDIDAVDDNLLDGTQTVTITSAAAGYVDGADSLDVTDHETLTLSLAPASISESGGSAIGTVTRSSSTAAGLAVALASSDLAVAAIVTRYGMDDTTIAAALLHDAVEDTELSLVEVESDFGVEVAEIVDGVTKLERFQFDSKEAQQAATMRKMLVAMAKDIRVLVIKLLDRLHNIRTLAPLPVEKQQRVAKETIEVFGESVKARKASMNRAPSARTTRGATTSRD